MPPKKRPAAKTAKASGTKRKKTNEPVKAEVLPESMEPEEAEEEKSEIDAPEEEPEEAEGQKPGKAESPKKDRPKKMTPQKKAKNPKVKVEVSSPKETKLAKAKGKALPPPKGGARVWHDVRNQVDSLAKKGKPELKEAWKKAKTEGHQAKREFYYNIFLLSPEVARKSIHKESSQEVAQTSSLQKGWMTIFKHGTLQGLDPADPNFHDLCLKACEGLPTREHENPGLAKAGVLQVYAEVQDLEVEHQRHKSLIKAEQKLDEDSITQEAFDAVETSVKVNKQQGQRVLGGKDKKEKEPRALAGTAPGNTPNEPDKAEAYSKALKRLRAPVGQFNSQSDKASLLLQSLEKKSLSKAEEQLQFDAVKQSLKKAIRNAGAGKDQWLASLGTLPQDLDESIAENAFADKMQRLSDLKSEVDTEVATIRKLVLSKKSVAEQLSFQA